MTARPTPAPAPGTRIDVVTPMQGRIVAVSAEPGDHVRPGRSLVVIEAMKMEHVMRAECDGLVLAVNVTAGDAVKRGAVVMTYEARVVDSEVTVHEQAADPDHIRDDLDEVLQRRKATEDASRPDSVARRRATGQRTARENIAQLIDDGTWDEWGQLVVASQRGDLDPAQLSAKSPADGLVMGVGSVNGAGFGPKRSQTLVLASDYTVFAGTLGRKYLEKLARGVQIAKDLLLPVVLYAEGGGGRAADDWGSSTGLAGDYFRDFASLSRVVPLVGITSGRCFAGNAALLSACDVIIATRGSNIGLGGPSLVEGGGLGTFAAEEIGPLDVQLSNGVVDIPAEDEADATRLAQKYLSYFQGAIEHWECADQRELREVVPANRLRSYDVRTAIEKIADRDSVLELRPGFAQNLITALIRVEGRPLGVFANNPQVMGGAIDAEAAEKMTRFFGICNDFGIPLLSMTDTPGMMVGPDAERTGIVRRTGELFAQGAKLTTPVFMIILRKSYGLGSAAMAGGSYRTPAFTVSWPTGEFAGMGIEGEVRLGHRRELEAIADPVEREAFFQTKVAELYAFGKAVKVAEYFDIDAVIDPADSRRWIVKGLDASFRKAR